MLAAPWYLLATGIALLVVGGLSGALFGVQRDARNRVDARMSDAEIAARLDRGSSLGFSGFLVFAGVLCLAVSFGWRLLARFL